MTKIRIAVLQFSHETVTFLANDTTLEDFTYPGSPASGEALLGSGQKSYIGGFVQLAREHADVALVGITSPLFPRTGTGSGWVTAEAFEHFAGRMIEELRAGAPWDGVYLSLHGAMAVRGVARPEAELARRVREAVGSGAVLAGTFDPHGNEDEQFLQHADMAFAVKFFPHYDAHLQGERAARTMIRAIRGAYRPAHAVVKVPIISPTVLQWTGASPWMDLVQRALVWEAREPDTFVNVFFGFPWSDVPDVGMTIQVISNGGAGLARRVADDMAAYAWRRREALLHSASVHTIADGVKRAAAAVASGAKPVVLADHSDRSGAATWLLRAVMERGLARVLVATVADQDCAQAFAGAKPGDAFDREVGGRLDASAGMPVRVHGTVAFVAAKASGAWIGVTFGVGCLLVVSPYLVQVMEPQTLTALGIDLADFDVIAIKSRVHFRRGFDDTGFAKTILLVEPPEPFLGTVRLDGLPYANVALGRYFPYGEVAFP